MASFNRAYVDRITRAARIGRRPEVTDRHREPCLRIDDITALKLAIAGNRIREVRDELGISIAELAAACGVTVGAVARWETRGGISLWRLFQVAAAMRVPVDHLISSR